MHAFILAGGFATRLWPLTEKRAKPLLPLAGKPLLTHIVEKIPREIPVTVSTNVAFQTGFEKWKQTQNRPIAIVIEHTTKDADKLGALGAVAQWIQQEHCADDLLLLTGDNYFGFSFDDFLKTYHAGIPLIATYDIREKEKAMAFGVVMVERGNMVIGFEEKPKKPLSNLVSTGCSILPQHVLPILAQYAHHHPDNIGGIFEELLREGQHIECFIFREPWFDIGSYDAYLEATQALVPAGKPVMHPTAEIDEGSRKRCGGSVVIGAGTRILNSELINTILFENCTVNDCVLERCILADHCALHGIDLTGKMLRSGTTLTSTPLP